MFRPMKFRHQEVSCRIPGLWHILVVWRMIGRSEVAFEKKRRSFGCQGALYCDEF